MPVRPGGKRPGWQTWLGVLWGFSGIALLVGPAEFSGNGTHLDLVGVGVLLLAAFLWSAGSLYSRQPACPTPPDGHEHGNAGGRCWTVDLWHADR